MSQQKQRRLVGPVQVFKDGYNRRHSRRALHKLAIGIEQEPTLLFRGQLDRLWNVGIHAPQLRHQLGDFRSGIANGVAERLPRHCPRAVLQHFDERHIRGRAFHFIAVANHCKASAAARFTENCTRKMGFADAGFTSDEHQSTASGERRVKQTKQFSPLLVTSDQAQLRLGFFVRAGGALHGKPRHLRARFTH